MPALRCGTTGPIENANTRRGEDAERRPLQGGVSRLHPAAVGIVLLSALAHVYWNYGMKRSPAPALYAWWIQAGGALLFAPLGVRLARPLAVPAAGWYCVAGTALLYGAYFTFIALSYDREDLSRAYPIARGVAPVATAGWGGPFPPQHPR